MYKLINISLIKAGSNVRSEHDNEISELAKDIGQNGLLQPLSVRKTDDGKYEIIAGHRRFLALKQLGEDQIECNIIEYVNDEDRLNMQLSENIHRKNMSAYEYVQVFDEMKKKNPNLTNKMIAYRVHKSEQWVSAQYSAVKILEREYGYSIPEEKKKQSVSVIRAEAKRKSSKPSEEIKCVGFTVKKHGHTYMIYCTDFDAEQELNELINKRRR